MESYGLLVCAYVYDLLNIGLIGHRGRIILTLIGAALVLAWWRGPIGWLGLGLGVATVLGVRRLGEWLRHEGGLEQSWAGTLAGLAWLAGYVGDMIRRLCEVLSPVSRETCEEPTLDAQPSVPRNYGTAVATPDMMRWTPGWTPPVAPDGLHSVETYSDWLPTSVEQHGGFNAAAREAGQRWGVSRSKFARDMRGLREEVA